uniref:Uncharacterized protein n=1 Tax=Oryza meridionalis TaxID=40149 RepID=A0A0E0EA75_9ORYZ
MPFPYFLLAPLLTPLPHSASDPQPKYPITVSQIIQWRQQRKIVHMPPLYSESYFAFGLRCGRNFGLSRFIAKINISLCCLSCHSFLYISPFIVSISNKNSNISAKIISINSLKKISISLGFILIVSSTYIYISPYSPQFPQNNLERKIQIRRMLQVQGSLRVHTFSSAAIVHAVETSDEDSDPSHFCAVPQNGKKASRKEIKRRIKKLLSSLGQKNHISKVFFRSRSEAANSNAVIDNRGGGQSDMETFVSAKSSELCSFRTHDDDSESRSFRLSPLPIFPTGGIEFQPPASPVKIIKKLPFGYIIGRQLDGAPAAAVPSTKLSLSFKKLMPKLVDMQLKSKSKMIKKKVFRALKRRFGGGKRQGRDGHVGEGKESSDDGDGDGNGDDEDVFWRKDVRGLRCRRVEDNDLPY